MPPELLQLLQQMLQQRAQPQPQPQGGGFDIASLLKATEPDPVGRGNRLSGLPSYAPGSESPFNTGFFNPENSAASLSPAARAASQGNNAMNQWASLGFGAIPQGQMQSANAAMAAVPNAGPPMSGFGAIEPPPMAPAGPQVGSWLGGPATGWELVGPKNPGEGGGSLLGMVPPVGPISPNETPFGIMNPPAKRRKPLPAGVSASPGFSAGGFSY